MGSIIGFLVTKGLSEKVARIVAIGGLILLVLSVLGTAKCAYDRSVIKTHEAKIEAEQANREEKADANLHQQKAKDDEAARQRKKEIEDATRNIPDQATSPRQRARACLELRRQGQNHPAC